MYTRYRQGVEKKLGTQVNPKRIIFYRGERKYRVKERTFYAMTYADGVSEGQFKQVLDLGKLCRSVPMSLSYIYLKFNRTTSSQEFVIYPRNIALRLTLSCRGLSRNAY